MPEETKPAPKPGWKTTEFWGMFAAVLVSAILSSDLLPEGHLTLRALGVVSVVLASLGYTASRTVVKRAP